MKLFLKPDALVSKTIVFWLAILDAGFIIFGIIQNEIRFSLMLAFFITALVLIPLMLCSGEGLYIDGDALCYKGFTKKYYKADDVKRLHIVRVQIRIGYSYRKGHSSDIDLKDFKGNYHYEIMYLKNRDLKLGSTDYGKIDFYINHKKDILFSTRYDERVIDYFKLKGIPITGREMIS